MASTGSLSQTLLTSDVLLGQAGSSRAVIGGHRRGMGTCQMEDSSVGIFPSEEEYDLRSELYSLANAFFSEVRGTGPDGYGEAMIASKQERIAQLRAVVLQQKGGKGLKKAHSEAMGYLWRLIRDQPEIIDMRDGTPGDRFYKSYDNRMRQLLNI